MFSHNHKIIHKQIHQLYGLMVAQDVPHYLDFSRRTVPGLQTTTTLQSTKICTHGTQERMFFISSHQQVLGSQWETLLKIELIMITLSHQTASTLSLNGIHCTRSSKAIPCLFLGRAMEAFMFLILLGRFISQIISVVC